MTTISILIPAYRHERFVEQAVRSVFAQTRRPAEIIAIDDQSPDDTFAILQGLADESPVPFRLLRNDVNSGVASTLNRALSLARSEWVGILPTDDFYQPSKLERHLAYAERKSHSSKVSHCNAISIDAEGHEYGAILPPGDAGTREGDVFSDVVEGTTRFVSGTMIAETAFLRDIGGFDETLRAEDFDLHLRAARRTEFSFLDEPLYFARIVLGSLGRRPSVWTDDVFMALSKHKDVLGERWQGILTRRLGRAAVTCLLNDDWEGALRYGRRAFSEARRAPIGTRVQLGLMSASALSAAVVRKPLRTVLPHQVRLGAYRFLRKRNLV